MNSTSNIIYYWYDWQLHELGVVRIHKDKILTNNFIFIISNSRHRIIPKCIDSILNLKNIEKWQLDEEGQRRIFSGRNREQREVVHEVHEESLEELHEDGEQAVELTPESLQEFLNGHEMAFIDFYAP